MVCMYRAASITYLAQQEGDPPSFGADLVQVGPQHEEEEDRHERDGKREANSVDPDGVVVHVQYK